MKGESDIYITRIHIFTLLFLLHCVAFVCVCVFVYPRVFCTEKVLWVFLFPEYFVRRRFLCVYPPKCFVRRRFLCVFVYISESVLYGASGGWVFATTILFLHIVSCVYVCVCMSESKNSVPVWLKKKKKKKRITQAWTSFLHLVTD